MKKKKYNGFYLMAQYPDKERFLGAIKKGFEFFDFLEVGFPFSDPIADGPTIAEAGYQVISQGITMDEVLDTIREAVSMIPEGKKIYMMTYANHIYQRGTEVFASKAKKAGLSGVIIPDLPRVEAGPFTEAFSHQGLDFIYFITPESSSEQIQEAASLARGFLYAVSMRGITGENAFLDEEIRQKINLAQKACTVPVVLGFGIRTADLADQALEIADGFIIGTRIVELVGEPDFSSYTDFIDQLKEISAGSLV